MGKERIGTAIKEWISYLLIAFLIPVAVTLTLSGIGEGLGNIKLEGIGRWAKKAVTVSSSRINVYDPDAINEYIVGVVSDSYDFCDNIEYLKAMAVIIRTYIIYCEEHHEEYKDKLVYLDDTELAGRWGDGWEDKKQVVKAAVYGTSGEYISSEQKAIYPFTHYITSGYTRQKEGYSYTCEVGQEEQCISDEFVNTKLFENSEFVALIKSIAPEAMIDEIHPVNDIQIISKTKGGYVTQIQIGNVILDGDQVAEILGLDSPAFTFSEVKGKICCTTKGKGTGYGVSLYGAALEATSGRSYKEILGFYYSEVAFSNIE